MIAAAYTAVVLVLVICIACGARILPGRERLACLHRSVAIRVLIAWTLAAIAAVYVTRTVRHPLRYAGYLAARRRRIGRADPDGEPLDHDEMRAFIGVVQCWKYPAPPERSRT